MSVTEKNDFYPNYIPLGAGTFKNVFQRKKGYAPKDPRYVSYRQKNRYVSSFLTDEGVAVTELIQSGMVRRLDPLEVFTVQPEHYLSHEDPSAEKKKFLTHLRDRMTKFDKKIRERNYLYEIIYPYAGTDFTKVLEQKSMQGLTMSLKEFLFPILFLIYWVGYMNDAGFSHKDIKDNNIMYKDGRLYLIDFGFLSTSFADVYGHNREHPTNPPELELLLRLRDSGTEDYLSLNYTRDDYMDALQENFENMFDVMDFYHRESGVPVFLDVLNGLYVLGVKKDNLKAAGNYEICHQAIKSIPKLNEETKKRKEKECVDISIRERLQTFHLHGQKFDAYQLGCTILMWCAVYSNLFHDQLESEDKLRFDEFVRQVTWHLTTFDVTQRFSLSRFHSTILSSPVVEYIFVSVDFLDDYSTFCRKIYKPLKNIQTKDTKQFEYVEKEKRVFEKLLNEIKTGMKHFVKF